MLARAVRMTAAAPELKLDTYQGEDACLKCHQNHGGAAMPVPIVSGRLHEPFNLALGEVLARWASAEVIEHVPTLLSGTWVCNFCYKRQVH